MYKTIVCILPIFLFFFSSAQNFLGIQNGVGEYMPGRAITAVIKKKKAEKKLTFFISQTGKVTGNLITTYKNTTSMLGDEIQVQHFLVGGNYDSSKKSLLLVLTHIKTGTKKSEAYLTFKKPDSVFYHLSHQKIHNKIIITCIPDNTLNRSLEEFWVENTLLGGLSSYVSDKNNAHLLPMRIRFEEENPDRSEIKTILSSLSVSEKKNSYSDSPKLSVREKAPARKTIIRRVINLDTCSFKIELYDNGEIDGDIASLILDGKVIIDKHLLGTKSASLNIDLSDQMDHEHVLELFANNMGLIPPNTALLVLTCNKKRFEITLSSTEEINEAVILRIKP